MCTINVLFQEFVIQGLKFCFISFLLNFLRGIYLSVFQLIFSNSARKPSLSSFFVSRRYILCFLGTLLMVSIGRIKT